MAYYRYTFADGYFCYATGMEPGERHRLELLHGNLQNRIKL